MDWKKETISPAEFERREREYISAAVAMMKRSTGPGKVEVTERLPPEDMSAEENVSEDVSEEDSPAEVVSTDESAAEDVSAEDSPVKDGGAEENKDKDDSAEDSPEEAEPSGESPGEFGVYTADEIAESEYRNDGLKKAAEILEEMTKNTAMMRKLAEAGTVSEGDITDFPDFSFRESGNGGFREEGKENDAGARKNE